MTANQGMITGGAPYRLNREISNDNRTDRVAHLFRGGMGMLSKLIAPTAKAMGHPVNPTSEAVGHPAGGASPAGAEFNAEYSYLNAATCPDCGSGMVRLGGCFSCPACGFSSCEI